MNEFIDKLIELGTNVGGKILFAVLVLIVGSMFIKAVKKWTVKALEKSKFDPTIHGFIKNLVSVLLYIAMVLVIIEIIGIPMTSVVTVLASCGLAVGLALQGALANLAGGIMLLVFKPFRTGDYVDASGAAGVVKDISMFYTTILTLDNKRITIPNGDIMNGNVTNYSSEDFRRVDLDFKITNDCDEDFAKSVLLSAAEKTPGVLDDPAPFARLSAVDDDTFIFTVRAWCNSASYWDVYFDLLESCSKALGENEIDDPEERIAVRIVEQK